MSTDYLLLQHKRFRPLTVLWYPNCQSILERNFIQVFKHWNEQNWTWWKFSKFSSHQNKTNKKILLYVVRVQTIILDGLKFATISHNYADFETEHAWFKPLWGYNYFSKPHFIQRYSDARHQLKFRSVFPRQKIWITQNQLSTVHQISGSNITATKQNVFVSC